jgi:hypothetical protein
MIHQTKIFVGPLKPSLSISEKEPLENLSQKLVHLKNTQNSQSIKCTGESVRKYFS